MQVDAMPIPTAVSPDTPWRASLADVQDLVLAAGTIDEIVQALLQLTTLMARKWNQEAAAAVREHALLELLHDASRLLHHDTRTLNWGDDVRDWHRRAEAFLR